MRIFGAESLTREQLEMELNGGAKLIRYSYCISLIAVTIERYSPLYFIPANGNQFLKGWPYTLISLVLGWWGVPWGILQTPRIIFKNLGGGEDVTEEIQSFWSQE